MYRKILAVGAAVALTLVTAGSASAEGNGGATTNATKLRLGGPYHGADSTPSACGSIAFKDVGTNGNDSPIDSNDRALVADICSGDFAEAYTNRALQNRNLATLKNVSFDYLTSTITGAGQVYIFALMTDGAVVFLDPAHCTAPIQSSSTWSRADFTGETDLGACTVYDGASVPYTSNGTQSALQVYEAAHPGSIVSITDMVFSGSATVDRVAIGTNKLFNFSPVKAISCQFNEVRC